MAHAQGQQHPVSLYLKIWGLLFVLSTLSYLVDYFHFEGYFRWSLILVLMLLKAGLIVSIFMHMAWERLAMVYAILVPPLCLLVLVGLMAAEADYVFSTRGFSSGNDLLPPPAFNGVLYRSLELMPFLQPGHYPVRGCCAGSGDLQLWVMADDPIQDSFLSGFHIHEEDVLAVPYRLFQIAEMGIGYLDTKETAFPDTEAQDHDRQEDERHPAGRGLGPTCQIGTEQYQCRERYANDRANLTGVNDILLHE